MEIEAQLARARHVATSTWSDALDALGIDGVIDGLTVRSGIDASAAGIAVTVRERMHDLDLATTSQFDVGRLLDALHDDSFLVIDGAGAPISTFGGLAAMAADRAGATGVAIDGACRDLTEVLRTGLWVASRHVTPRSGKGRILVEDVNVPIRLGGILIEPGDVMIGDATGLVRVPRARFDEALTRAEGLAQRDARFAAALHTTTFANAVRQVGDV